MGDMKDKRIAIKAVKVNSYTNSGKISGCFNLGVIQCRQIDETERVVVISMSETIHCRIAARYAK